jgi:hypothetical protein
LGAWLGETPSSASFGQLMLRLDEFGVGGVTPSCLDEIAAGHPLKDVLKMYMNTGNLLPLTSQWGKPLLTYGILDGPIPSPSSKSKHDESQIMLPLLVWIDDNPTNYIREVAYAHQLGINVIQLTSTALAKAWIEEHNGQYNSSQLMRFSLQLTFFWRLSETKRRSFHDPVYFGQPS